MVIYLLCVFLMVLLVFIKNNVVNLVIWMILGDWVKYVSMVNL